MGCRRSSSFTFETFIRPTGCSGLPMENCFCPQPLCQRSSAEQLLPTIAEMASSISGQPVQVTVLAERLACPTPP